MNTQTHNFDAYAFSTQPDYDEPKVRREFAKLMPLRTVIIYCYDPACRRDSRRRRTGVRRHLSRRGRHRRRGQWH